jgi:Fe-S cluster assembly iron-binding protein IscA
MENTNNISISKNAAEKIKNIISSQEKGLILKI